MRMHDKQKTYITQMIHKKVQPWNGQLRYFTGGLQPSKLFSYWPFQGGASIVDLICISLCCASVSVFWVLWAPVGEGLTSRLSCVCCFLCFCHFPIGCPGSGVVLDSIDFLSLPSFLLSKQSKCYMLKRIYHLWSHFITSTNILPPK